MMLRLSRFLAVEAAAVAAYRLVIGRFPDEHIGMLHSGLHSHEMLMESLRAWIENLGEPASSGDDGNCFADLDQVASDHAGYLHAITILRQGERAIGLESGQDLDRLDEFSRVFIERQVVPEHARCLSALG
jgi:hypothetical protein